MKFVIKKIYIILDTDLFNFLELKSYHMNKIQRFLVFSKSLFSEEIRVITKLPNSDLT